MQWSWEPCRGEVTGPRLGRGRAGPGLQSQEENSGTHSHHGGPPDGASGLSIPLDPNRLWPRMGCSPASCVPCSLHNSLLAEPEPLLPPGSLRTSWVSPKKDGLPVLRARGKPRRKIEEASKFTVRWERNLPSGGRRDPAWGKEVQQRSKSVQIASLFTVHTGGMNAGAPEPNLLSFPISALTLGPQLSHLTL